MSENFKNGVIDFVSETSIRGWFDLCKDGPVSAVLLVDKKIQTVELTRTGAEPLRWRFHASPLEPLTVADFKNGNAKIRVHLSETYHDLKLWKPLAVAASIQDLNPSQLKVFLKAIPERKRKQIIQELSAREVLRFDKNPQKPRSERRALFGNAEFRIVAGSELVILELIEELTARGWRCDITAWSIGEPMQDLARRAGANLIKCPAKIRAFNYDLIWLNNRLEAVFDYEVTSESAPRTLFVFGHFDRDWSYAQPGVAVEKVVGELFLVPAPAGIRRLNKYGLPTKKIRLFRNPAPRNFELSPRRSSEMRRILIVSNHAPPEVLETAKLLHNRGIDVEHWGMGGTVRNHRITPDALIDVDAVLSIGKTVPYAIRARRPAYVYDHFGGPGWLSKENFNSAAERNFSGLCCERRLDALSLCSELLAGFKKASAAASEYHSDWASNYRLEDEVTQILELQKHAAPPQKHRERLELVGTAWQGERELALTAGTYFRDAIEAHRDKLSNAR